MKQKVKRINKLLKKQGFKASNRLALKIYLSIVLLGCKIPESAAFFKESELKVQADLTKCGVRLKNDVKFRFKIHKVAKAFMFS